MKVTLSVIKADTGSVGGHNKPSEAMVSKAKEVVAEAVRSGLLTDGRVTYTGDDIALTMAHTRGVDNSDIHKLAWDTFVETTKIAKSQGLYGAGQDLLKDAFSGNVKGMGPGSAEMEIEERPAEPFIVFTGDKCGPGVFNYPLFEAFASPYHNAGLLLAPEMNAGFTFTFHGFPPEKAAHARKLLDGIAHQTMDGKPVTHVFYCSPHKLETFLRMLLECFGDIRITVARELTKVHEQYWDGTVNDAINHRDKLIGEMVLILQYPQ